MGINVYIQNTQGKTIFSVAWDSSIQKPKEFTEAMNASYNLGLGLFVPTDDTFIKHVLAWFEAHLILELPKFKAAYPHRQKQSPDSMLQGQMMASYDEWAGNVSSIKKAIREHKHLVISCG